MFHQKQLVVVDRCHGCDMFRTRMVGPTVCSYCHISDWIDVKNQLGGMDKVLVQIPLAATLMVERRKIRNMEGLIRASGQLMGTMVRKLRRVYT